jgi:hypothetical protein
MMLAAPRPLAAESMAAANWHRHPQIVEIRAIYRQIKRAEIRGQLSKQQKTFRDCSLFQRVLHHDAGGVVRLYKVAAASEHYGIRYAYYYDRNGRLRFVFIDIATDNGTQIEYRVYLSEAGERLWEERRHLKGPGWSFPDKLPDDWLVRDPRRAFDAKSACPEVK